MFLIPPNFIEITPAYVAVPDIPPVASGNLVHHWVGLSGGLSSAKEFPDVINHVDGVLLNGAIQSSNIPNIKWDTHNSIRLGFSYLDRME